MSDGASTATSCCASSAALAASVVTVKTVPKIATTPVATARLVFRFCIAWCIFMVSSFRLCDTRKVPLEDDRERVVKITKT
jgi:hypothetical protein